MNINTPCVYVLVYAKYGILFPVLHRCYSQEREKREREGKQCSLLMIFATPVIRQISI